MRKQDRKYKIVCLKPHCPSRLDDGEKGTCGAWWAKCRYRRRVPIAKKNTVPKTVR